MVLQTSNSELASAAAQLFKSTTPSVFKYFLNIRCFSFVKQMYLDIF
jgi:hypothetical protein